MPILHAEHLEMLVWCNLDDEDPEPRAVPLRPPCHPEATFQTAYNGEREGLFMACATCGQGRLAIAMARVGEAHGGEVDDDDPDL
jgi:hypothetical protein